MNKAERAKLVVSVAAFALILGAIVAYAFAVRPWMLNWGATPRERTQALLGDDAWIGGVVTGTLAVTVQSTTDKVWERLIAIGQDRAGFYSYTWLENLVLADIHNTYEIRPEWQGRQAKDLVRSVKPGYLFGLLKKEIFQGWRVSFVEPGQAMTLRNWGTFALKPSGTDGTRFLIRSRGGPLPGIAGRLVSFWLLDPAHFVMEKTMMLEIKRLAEGRPGPPGWLRALATAGFASAALGAALLIGSRKRRGFWLLVPGAYAALILAETADAAAALAGFTALALVIVGFAFFPKRWWIYFGSLWIVVYAGLFFAADAWIVFGLVLLAATGAAAVAAVKGLRPA